MARYKLPEALGGGEVEAEMTWSGCDGARREYKVAGSVTILTYSNEPLREIPPPYPTEPADGSVLRLVEPNGKSQIVERDDGALSSEGEYRWWSTNEEGSLRWVDLPVRGATIIPLVPALEPVSLPWKARSQTGHFEFTVTPCRDSPSGRLNGNVNVAIDGLNATATATNAVAREMARALLTAAGDL